MEPTDSTFMELIMARIGAYRVGLIGFVFGLVTSTAAAMTTERSWMLEKGQGVTTLKNSPASLTLNNKQLSGSTGCNTFRATLNERAENRVAINDVAVTRKLCAPPASDNERAIVEAFNKTEFIEEGADRLTFLSGSREPLLVWRPAKKAAGRDQVIAGSKGMAYGSSNEARFIFGVRGSWRGVRREVEKEIIKTTATGTHDFAQ
jgi:heat shock protein HslJ